MKLCSSLLAVLPLAVAQTGTTYTVSANSTSTSASASATATGSSNSSRIIPIDVGNGGLIFSPNATTANVGDTLSFTFYPQNHSVAQSTFAQPCQPANDAAIFSGFYPIAAGQESVSRNF